MVLNIAPASPSRVGPPLILILVLSSDTSANAASNTATARNYSRRCRKTSCAFLPHFFLLGSLADGHRLPSVWFVGNGIFDSHQLASPRSLARILQQS